jgi:RNA polymerase sigma-70 factor (ECF subfamily)
MRRKPATAVPRENKLRDTELVRRIIAGDHNAFRLLVRRYNRMLFRVARSILKDDVEAEDAMQQAYMSACRAIDAFRARAKLSTWLVRIVVNEAIALSRKRSRRTNLISPDGDAEYPGETAEPNLNTATPEQPEHATQRMQMRRMLEASIDALPDALRTVFILRAVEEMTVKETAIALDVPEATVRTRFFRAKRLLREALSREIDEVSFDDVFPFAGAYCDRVVVAVLAGLKECSHPLGTKLMPRS